MKIKYFFTAVLMTFGFTSLSAQDVSAQGTDPQIIPGQYIVQFKDKPAVDETSASDTERPGESGAQAAGAGAKRAANNAKVKSVQTKHGIKANNVLHEYSDAMVGFAAKLSDDDVRKLKSDPNVAGVYPDYVISLGPTPNEANPSDITPLAQTVPCGITKAGGPLDGSTKATWIWILDTGIDGGHPDLNVQTNAIYAKSFIAGQSAIIDGNSHGTHCAGIAAAKNNAIGVVGVSSGAKVVPVKVLSNAGSGTFAGIIAGLNHVMSKKIAGDVVSMSIGSGLLANCQNGDPVLRDVIRALGNAGVWVCIAAGNNGNCTGATMVRPGCINGVRVLTVGSITCQNACSGFSNWGVGTVDWAAVGSNVYSTVPGGGYGTKSGTSMATPNVAGICHARPTGPISAGNVTCCGAVYRIARR